MLAVELAGEVGSVDADGEGRVGEGTEKDGLNSTAAAERGFCRRFVLKPFDEPLLGGFMGSLMIVTPSLPFLPCADAVFASEEEDEVFWTSERATALAGCFLSSLSLFSFDDSPNILVLAS